MEIVMAFVSLINIWIATIGSYAIVCLILFAYRTNRCPSLDSVFAFICSCILLWLTPQQSNEVWAGISLVGAATGGFITGAIAGAELDKAKPNALT